MSKRNPNLACPMVSRNSFDPYESPVGERGRMITTRKEREKDLLEHEAMPTNDVNVKPEKELPQHARRKR